MLAFERLSTCRSVGMGLGPIPWRDIVAYADRVGLDRGEAGALVTIIEAMDRAYLDFHNEKEDGSSGSE